MYWALLAAVAVFVVPFLLGKLIGRALRMKDISVRVGVVLLAATLGLTPFIAQWVLGIQEQRQYESAIAEWRQTGEERLSNSRITDAGLERLQQAVPGLQILRETGDEGQLALPPARPAGEGGAPRLPGGPETER